MVTKTIRVRLTVELDIDVPHCFSKKDIERDEDLHLAVEAALADGDVDIYVETLDETPRCALRNAN
jgi:hypothetical protein